jgi:hypothetical protein
MFFLIGNGCLRLVAQLYHIPESKDNDEIDKFSDTRGKIWGNKGQTTNFGFSGVSSSKKIESFKDFDHHETADEK